jgi:Xaa-Pro dipeptidase
MSYEKDNLELESITTSKIVFRIKDTHILTTYIATLCAVRIMSSLLSSVQWEELRKSRLEKTQKLMEKNDLDLLLLTVLEDVRYVTDVKPVFGIDYAVDGYAAVVPAKGPPTLLRPFAGENPSHLPEMSTAKYVYVQDSVTPDEWAKLYEVALRNSADKKKIQKIGVDHLTFEIYHSLNTNLRASYVPFLTQMLETRAVKLPEEVKLMREAARIVDVGMEAAQRSLNDQKTEFQVAGEVLKAMTSEGIEQVPFWPVVVSGKSPPSSESSGVFTSHRKISDGDVVIVDHGVFVKSGYAGDYGRVLFVGSGQEKAKRLYKDLYEIIMSGIKIAKPGVYTSELDDVCRRTTKELGYPDPEAEIGHGMGLKVAELPRVTRPKEAKKSKTDTKLKSNMIINLEPIAHIPKEMWMWVENTLLITDSGCEILTKFPFEPA